MYLNISVFIYKNFVCFSKEGDSEVISSCGFTVVFVQFSEEFFKNPFPFLTCHFQIRKLFQFEYQQRGISSQPNKKTTS